MPACARMCVFVCLCGAGMQITELAVSPVEGK